MAMLRWHHLVAILLAAHSVANVVKCQQFPLTEVKIDFGQRMDPPLVKKFGLYNSGIIPPERYTQEVILSMGLLKASSFRLDMSIGKENAGFFRLFDLSDDGDIVYNFSLIDGLASGLQEAQVPPYWGLSYAPAALQPECEGGLGSENCTDSRTTCLGFEDKAHVPGTNNYSCTPAGSSLWDDCWKCPPKLDSEDEYGIWSEMVAGFHKHLADRDIGPMFEEHWNEPDLTEYYNPTVATYKGSNEDYNAAYMACAESLKEVDTDVVFGGIAAANQIRHNLDFPLQPSCEDTLLEAARRGAQMDFLSYHSITTSPGANQIQLVIDRAQTSREVLATPELLNITGELNPYDTTEIHCNEFFPNATVETLSVEFSSSAYLAVLLLESFYLFLEERDLMQVHWAQYMDIFNTDDQIGLLTYSGNPRPAWWTFKWFADLPEERVEFIVESEYIRGMASYSTRENRGGVLLWNVPNVAFGLPSKEVRLEVVMKNMPVAVFDLEAYIIDDKKQPERGFNYRPAAVFAAQQTDANGSYVFPPEEYSGLKLPVNGTVYLNIVPIKPSALPTSPIDTLPETRILRLHHYFGKRPARSTMYAYMDQRTWSAHLGMGDESTGFAIAGATVKFIAEDPEILTVNLDLVEGGLSTSGMYGVRIDMPSSQSNTSIGSYQPEDSYFFYQEGRQPCAVPQAAAEEEAGRVGMYELDLSAGSTVAKAPEEHVEEGNRTGSYLYASNTVLSVNGRRLQLDASPQDTCRLGGSNGRLIQVPNLWGSKHPVPGRNFLPVNLSSFTFDALGFAPPGWDGRATILFVLKDGFPHTKVSARVTAL